MAQYLFQSRVPDTMTHRWEVHHARAYTGQPS